MRVTLAGYNIDAESIELIRELIDQHKSGNDPEAITALLDRLATEPFTPETIAAAYARISRSEKGVRELRIDARSSVNRARQSNEKIVFGLGHASIAEHAVFNLDVIELSRLAVEELESHRLASYTESSQRYISIAGDFETPEEISVAGHADRFNAVCRSLFESYRELSGRLEIHHSELPERDRQGRAREDARYLLPLATRGQVGMTVNARSLEYIIRTTAQSNLSEVRELSRKLVGETRHRVPSLIKYTDPDPRWAASRSKLARQVSLVDNIGGAFDSVRLLRHPSDDALLPIAAMIVSISELSAESALKVVERLSAKDQERFVLQVHSYLSEHLPVARELELVDFVFEIILSASAFGQLKRHRIGTLIKSPYDASLGVTIPPAVIEAGLEGEFLQAVAPPEQLFNELQESLPSAVMEASQYALTNAHRRRVILKVNARELCHISRLREDAHAQWDIRNITGRMVELARHAAPIATLLAVGKDSFRTVRNQIDAEVERSSARP